MAITSVDNAEPLGFAIKKIGVSSLRQKSEEVDIREIGGDELAKFLAGMKDTLKTAKGVGLAAPQVGVNLRIFITELPPRLESRYFGYTPSPMRIWINPSYTIISDETLGGREGCLSVPGYVGRVMRPASIQVQAFDENGREINETLSGWNARVFLHEYDHLDGVLYVDKLSEDADGRKEFFESSMWQQLEAEKRENGDTEWLQRFGLRQQEKI